MRGKTAKAAAPRLALTVLRAGRTQDLQLPLHKVPRFTDTFPYDCPLVASMRKDLASYSAKCLAQGHIALGKTIIPKSMAMLTLLGSHDSSPGELLKKCVDEFLSNSPNGVGGRPWTVGHAGMMLSEYYLATGDECVLPWLKETLAWAPQGTHISKFEVPVFGHGIGGIPYGRKSLVAPNIPMLAFDALAARRCGVDSGLWRLPLPYMTMSWYDPDEGGHGGVGYGAGTRTWRRQGWRRTGGFALAATLQGAKHIQGGTAQYMSNHHWGMRDTHAYGAPGAEWGLLGLSAADPEGFQHVMRQWAWQFVLAWEPGYGLRYSTYHMGCPYLPPETILTCGCGAVFSAENKGLHITGGQARNRLDVSGPPRAPRPVVVRRSQDGMVQMRCTVPGPAIRYTLDGREPSQDSTLYQEPFALPLGGVVTARSFGSDGTAGPIAKQAFGVAKTAWKVLGRSNPTNRYAFDGNPSTYWSTIRGSYATLPPYDFTVDLGKPQPLAGITVAHRADHMAGPQIKNHTVHVSADGKQWGDPVSAGELAGGTAVVRFPSLTHGRFLRLSALTTRGNWAWCSFAEFDVIDPQPELAWDKDSAAAAVLTCPDGLSIRYSLDGSAPTGESPIFGQTPYRLKPGDRVYARCANDEGWLGRPVVFGIRSIMVAKYTRKAFKGKWRSPPDFSKLTPVVEHRVDAVNREGVARTRVGALVFTSSMTALVRGELKLWVTAHNGAEVYINERLVIDCPPQNRRGNRDAPPVRKGASLPLEKGVHALRIECIRGIGDAGLGFGVDHK